MYTITYANVNSNKLCKPPNNCTNKSNRLIKMQQARV